MAEHLFSPGAPPKHIWIEYDGPLYDGGDWDTFPERGGWFDAPEAASFPMRGVIPYVKFPGEMEWIFRYSRRMESWLYFGMLHYVFGDTLDQSDFILLREQDGKQMQCIMTAHLHKYVDDAELWKTDKRSERAVEIVHKVHEALQMYIPWIQEGVCLAIRLASLALWNVAVSRDGPQPEPPLLGAWSLGSIEADTMQLFKGWCPLDVQKCLAAGIHLDTQMYLLQLRRTKPSWNNRTHEACTQTQCVADNIDESNYVTRHVTESCSCSHIHADVEQLHAIPLEGGIPLVSITPSGEDEHGSPQYEIEVVKKRSSKPYVAISHVWADGLGNPEGNSLPHCQLELLYERTRRILRDKENIPGYEAKVYGPLYTGAVRFAHFAGNVARRKDSSVLVWIDTLCIPHRSDVRSLAIQRIRKVYTAAARTMVLDTELMLINSDSCTKMEVCLRVLYYSGWIRRLWTLQEGMAAEEKLFVLLSDRAVNIGTIPYMLLNKVDQGELSIFQEGIATMAAAAWYSYFQEPTDHTSAFHRLVIQEGSGAQGAIIAWNWFNVATRASSKDRDRPTVLAGLLNLDISKILNIKETDERMRTIYSMLDMFPQDVLFLDGPRFDEYGLRWALKTCRFSGEFRRFASSSGNITPRGLQVTRYPSLIALSSDLFDLALAKSKRDESDHTKTDWEQWLDEAQPSPAPDDAEFDPEVEVDDELHPDTNLNPDADADAETNPSTHLSFLHLKGVPALDLQNGESYGIILESARTGLRYTTCALVASQTTEDGVHYGRYVSPGTLTTVTFDRNLHRVELPDEGYLLTGTWKDAVEWEWVIG
ncbi:hypothetical protein BJX70DRAFT_357318 [Aspergillus crustosus]